MHLRRTRDLRTRVFDDENPNLPGLFLFGHDFEGYFENRSQMNFTKIEPADLNSPRQELSNGGLRIVVALTVHWQIDVFACG